jgi:sialate O-acetylesterase
MVLQHDVPLTLTGSDSPGASISITFLGELFNTTASSAGDFSVMLPAAATSAEPTSIVVSSSISGSLTLSDVLVGDVFFCSGQSNMVIPVQDTAQSAAALADADALGPLLRLFQAALDPADANATAPHANVSASIPWSRASASSAGNMSATCYFTGASAVRARGAPLGLIASAWGGMPIQLFMSPRALAACNTTTQPAPLAELAAAASAPGASRAAVALGVAAAAELGLHPHPLGPPSRPSCLYFSMIAPFQTLPVAALIWYQGGFPLPPGPSPAAPRTRKSARPTAPYTPSAHSTRPRTTQGRPTSSSRRSTCACSVKW